LPQLALLGPALAGRTVNCPADLLALPSSYFPKTPDFRNIVPQDQVLSDLVFAYPAYRSFMATEFRAGRLPLWRPGNFAGAPFNWLNYSPFEWLYVLAPRPETLAWIQFIQMIVLGSGMWLFLRQGLRLSYWPAAIVSWCAPLTGFVSLWQGYPLVPSVCCFPWLLLLVERSGRRPLGWSHVGVAVTTALLLLSGAADVGGLVLLTMGMYWLWKLATDLLRGGSWRSAAASAAGMTGGWLAGFCLAAPYLLPMVEYARTGSRMHARAEGVEERPPVGIAALPAAIVPEFYGSTRRGSLRIVDGNLLESSSSAYAGLLAALWLAPLAWCHPRYRREAVFFTCLSVIALGWALNIPGLVSVLRLRPAKMLSYNRWTFATAYALLTLAAIGLEQLLSGPITFRRWFWIPILIVAGFGACCVGLVCLPPEPLYSQVEQQIRIGRGGRMSLADLHVVRGTFAICYGTGAFLSLATLLGWWATPAPGDRGWWCRIAIVGLLPAELFWFAAHQDRQADRRLYFPPIPALQKLARLPSGRVWGVQCLPPNLGFSHELEDIRGYDAVDPSRFVKIFDLACDRRFQSPPYATTQFAVPIVLKTENGLKLHPVADLLNVRYLVLRNPPGEGLAAIVHEDDYWVIENQNALPRAFVPRAVRVVTDDDQALRMMSNVDFSPKEVALMPVDPDVSGAAEGTVSIQYETPGRARLDAEMEADGIVVVSDMWNAGWKAELDGAACPIYRVDSALRAVRIPRGKHIVIMTYEPGSVRLGFQTAGTAGIVVLAWVAWLTATARRKRAT
jgi:hypothetical protein